AGGRRTTAPASSATWAVRSCEPSSATITSACGNALRSRVTVVPITASSSRAGTRMVSGSSTRRRRQRGNGRQLGSCGLLGSEGTGRSRIGEQSHERELPDPSLGVVDRRKRGPPERFGRGGRLRRTLRPDYRLTGQ